MSRFVLRPFGQQNLIQEEIIACKSPCVFLTSSGKKIFIPPLESLKREYEKDAGKRFNDQTDSSA
jgi:hypothetical protein